MGAAQIEVRCVAVGSVVVGDLGDRDRVRQNDRVRETRLVGEYLRCQYDSCGSGVGSGHGVGDVEADPANAHVQVGQVADRSVNLNIARGAREVGVEKLDVVGLAGINRLPGIEDRNLTHVRQGGGPA